MSADELYARRDVIFEPDTYDAEYLALARLLKCRLLTTDAKLKASGSTIVKVIGPVEL